MRIPVGPFIYTVELVSDYPQDSHGNSCQGTCDTASHAIRIARNLPPRKRWSVFWHEFAHALKTELDIGDAEILTEEMLCNLIGLGMSFLSPKQLCALHVLLVRGEPCDDVTMFRGQPIPIIRLTSEGS